MPEYSATRPRPFIDRAVVAALDPRMMRDPATTVSSINRAWFVRIPEGFSDARLCTKLAVWIQTSSGNLDLGVYADDGAGMPGARKASTGSTPSPGTQERLFTIAGIVIAPGDWFATSADNVTLAFLGSAGSLTQPFGLMGAWQDAAFPLPAVAAATRAAGRCIYVEGRP